MKSALILLSVFCFLFILSLFPFPIPPYLDFQVLYHADMGLLRGIPLYDHAGQVEMIARVANVPPTDVYVLPFPYPPWYALTLLPLALLPIQNAARIWFGLNLLVLLTSLGLMTDGWPPFKRALTALALVFFPPVIGTLLVGQYVLPVLLGAALWIYAAQKEDPVLVGLGSALLTFKPHLGALILLAGVCHLWLRGDDFGRRSLLYVLLTGILLFVLGFFADRLWPINYLRSLFAFSQDPGVSSCGLCASLPVALVSLFNGEASLAPAPLIGLIVFILLLLWLISTRREAVNDLNAVVILAVLVTMLSSPYLLNYDFVLLLLPLLWLVDRAAARLEWSLVLIAYLIPFVALGLWGRQGNIGFSFSAIILLILAYCRARPLDGLPRPAYNPE
jgi:glycosyl transferase family 87